MRIATFDEKFRFERRLVRSAKIPGPTLDLPEPAPQSSEVAKPREGPVASEYTEKYVYDGSLLYCSGHPTSAGAIYHDRNVFGSQTQRAVRPYFDHRILGLIPVLNSFHTPSTAIPLDPISHVEVLPEEIISGVKCRRLKAFKKEQGTETSPVTLEYWIDKDHPHAVRRVVQKRGDQVIHEITSEFWPDRERRRLPRKVSVKLYSPSNSLRGITMIVETGSNYDTKPDDDPFTVAGLNLTPGAEIRDYRNPRRPLLARAGDDASQVAQGLHHPSWLFIALLIVLFTTLVSLVVLRIRRYIQRYLATRGS